MAFKPYKPSVGSRGEEKAAERAWMTRKSVAKPVAKPTVKAVRDESRKDKAAVASKATTSPKYRGGPEGDGKTVARQSSGPVSRGSMSPAPVKSRTYRDMPKVGVYTPVGMLIKQKAPRGATTYTAPQPLENIKKRKEFQGSKRS